MNTLKSGMLIMFTALLCLLAACQKKDSPSGSSGKITLSGKLTDENGSAISNATIKEGSKTINVKDDGTFQISGLSNKADYKLEASAQGYFIAFKNIDLSDNADHSVTITMLSKTTLGTIDANGGTAGTTGLRVVATNSVFKKADGSTYTGPVTVSARYVQKDNTTLPNVMPGGDFKATDENGKDGGMRTYGFVATEFTNADNDIVTPTAGVKVAVTVPAGTNDPVTDGAQCWGYDNITGKWKKTGEITKDGPEYFFPCTTLYQNMDAFIQTGTIQGKVVCSGGKPAKYVVITVTNRFNKYITETNSNGDYKVTAEATNAYPYTIDADGNDVTVSTVPVNGTAQAPAITTSNCDPSQAGSGSFTVSSSTHSGQCSSNPDVGTGGNAGNIDVAILCTDGSGFIIYNMPKQSSGSYNFTDGYDNVGGSVLYGLCRLTSGDEYATKQGTVTKTGSNSFTFSCTVYDINTNQSFSVSGSGKY